MVKFRKIERLRKGICSMLRWFLLFSLSFIQFLALSAEFPADQLFKPFSIAEILLFAVILLLTKTILKKYRADEVKRTAPATAIGCLFSFFMIAGHSISTCGDLSEISFSAGRWLKTVIMFTGRAIFFFFCCQYIFLHLEKTCFKKRSAGSLSGAYAAFFDRHPFAAAFLTLFLLTLPGIIISYPGILTGDCYYQIAQGYGLENKKEWAVVSPPPPVLYKTVDGERIRVDTKISNYQPAAHTMLLHGCMVLGNRIFHTDNAGLFLLVMLQNLLLDLILAHTVSTLYRSYGLDIKWCLAFMVYFILHPGIRSHMAGISKEGIYVPFLILSVFEIAGLITGKGLSHRKAVPLCVIGTLGVILFRNEGKFLLTVSYFLLFLFFPGKRKIFGTFFFGTLLFAGLYETLLLPALNVAPGNIREMLSVPFQQTARYVRDAGDEITDEEREHIEKILYYEELPNLYNPNLSDPVKKSFNLSATSSDLKRYAITWFHMLSKRPDIYILAVMNNYYQYFYPDNADPTYLSFGFSKSEMWMVNRDCAEINMYLHYPENLSGIRSLYESVIRWIFCQPLTRCIWVSALYVWALFLYAAYCLYQKRRDAFVIAVPMLVQILIYITGPTNGQYNRYILMLKVCLPVILLTGLTLLSCRAAADRTQQETPVNEKI